MTNLNKDNVVEELVKRVPELKSVYDDEIVYYGEISNYVFFGSLLSKFIVQHRTNVDTTHTNKALNSVFAYIEECVETGNPELHDLVLAGFLESFIATLQDYPELRKLLGVKTSELLTLFE